MLSLLLNFLNYKTKKKYNIPVVSSLCGTYKLVHSILVGQNFKFSSPVLLSSQFGIVAFDGSFFSKAYITQPLGLYSFGY